MARKKMTDKQKAKRKANRQKYWALHCEKTYQADLAYSKGYYDAGDSYRNQADKAFDKFEENGGRLK